MIKKSVDVILSLYRKYVSLIRFGIVGVINTGVDFGVFTLYSTVFAGDPLIGQVLGYSAGFANSFIMNKLWTFESNKSKISTRIQLLKFAAVNLISLCLSLAVLSLLNGYLGMNKYFAKVIATGVTQIVNYIGYKIWVFNSPK